MKLKPIHVSAPGKLMLLGEHAVLHDKLSLVCAVNRRVRVSLTPRDDHQVNIDSALGKYSSELGKWKEEGKLGFSLQCIKCKEKQISQGFDLVIKSDFSDDVGLGSSAAVTVACTAALECWLKGNFDQDKVFHDSLKIIQEVQGGKGSGADVAASVFGGLLLYRKNPFTVKKLPSIPTITVVNSGHKEKTTKVIKKVEGSREKYSYLFDKIYDLMEESCLLAEKAVQEENWQNLGEILNLNQGLMDAIGVNNAKLSGIIYTLRNFPGIYGSKISGSGLGDCVVAIGQADLQNTSLCPLDIEISPTGVSQD